jgi:hypothetical protein
MRDGEAKEQSGESLVEPGPRRLTQRACALVAGRPTGAAHDGADRRIRVDLPDADLVARQRVVDATEVDVGLVEDASKERLVRVGEEVLHLLGRHGLGGRGVHRLHDPVRAVAEIAREDRLAHAEGRILAEDTVAARVRELDDQEVAQAMACARRGEAPEGGAKRRGRVQQLREASGVLALLAHEHGPAHPIEAAFYAVRPPGTEVVDADRVHASEQGPARQHPPGVVEPWGWARRGPEGVPGTSRERTLGRRHAFVVGEHGRLEAKDGPSRERLVRERLHVAAQRLTAWRGEPGLDGVHAATAREVHHVAAGSSGTREKRATSAAAVV